MNLKTNAFAELVVEDTSSRTHLFLPRANMANLWKLSSRKYGSKGRDRCCECQRKDFMGQHWNIESAPHRDVKQSWEESNNRGKKLWQLILENTLDQAISPNRCRTENGRKSASRQQTTELKGMPLSATLTLLGMDIDVRATKGETL